MRYATTWGGLGLALAILAAPLHAQQAPPATPQLPDSIQSLVQEFQTLRTHLGQVQDSALKATPALQEAQTEIQELIEEKMVEERPSLEADMERLEALRDEAAAAQQAQDQARLQELMQEGTQLRNQLEAAQSAAMEREEVQERMESFEAEMRVAMSDIDADIDEALARMEEVASRLQAFQNGGG